MLDMWKWEALSDFAVESLSSKQIKESGGRGKAERELVY